MPAAASAAREGLAEAAAAALDQAVALAARHGHGQTTSLHFLSSLLSSTSSSLLRDAVSRCGGAAQLKSLEGRLAAALGRLPTAARPDGPPVSNSLMAAVKRSQATQRRHQNQTAAVKVELPQLVFSLLDDPAAGKVLEEAGFRSRDVKVAVIRPPPSALQLAGGGRSPPLFLCNFDLTPRNFAAPFAGPPLAGEENCRRIAQVLLRRSGRNPLLVGAGAGDAARDFERALAGRACDCGEANGLEFCSLEADLVGFLSEKVGRAALQARLADLKPGTVIGFGDLKGIVDLVNDEKEGDVRGRLGFLVNGLKNVLEAHPGRIWLMGSAASYEIYTKLLSLHPGVDKDWDIQLLPITHFRAETGGPPHALPEETVRCSKGRSDCNLGRKMVESVSLDLALGTEGGAGPAQVADDDDMKTLYRSLVGKVPWQGEAAWAVSRAVSRPKPSRGIWIGLVGPDPVGKRKLAAALALSLYGSLNKMIVVDLYGQRVNGVSLTQRGKTVVDYLVEVLRRFGAASVEVFLENVDRVDFLVLGGLLRAIRTGRLADSFGREVSLNGAIFLAAANRPVKAAVTEFSEEAVLSASPRRLRLVVNNTASEPATKRQRVNRPLTNVLDLNLPVEREGYSGEVEELLGEMDERVETKPFDFDSIAEEVRRKLRQSTSSAVDIEADAMEQILSAAWAAEGGTALMDWVKRVLVGTVEGLASNAGHLRLVAGEALAETDELAPGIRLPAKILFS